VSGTVLEFVGVKKLFGEALKLAMEQHTIRQIMLNSATDMLPNEANRVVPSANQRDSLGIPRPDIKFKVDDYTRRAFIAALQVHARLFEAMGAVEFHLQGDSLADSGSGHIMGTTIMGASAKDSVVDSECRSHDNKNLYIAGSSVFPSAATANPTVTIAALALRNAEAIKGQLNA
jgi:choline dehydrogenase-like flavoprotein